jgi:hypothetical protein
MDKLSLRSPAAIGFFAIVALLVALMGPARICTQTSSGPLDDAKSAGGFRHAGRSVSMRSVTHEQAYVHGHRVTRFSQQVCRIRPHGQAKG